MGFISAQTRPRECRTRPDRTGSSAHSRFFDHPVEDPNHLRRIPLPIAHGGKNQLSFFIYQKFRRMGADAVGGTDGAFLIEKHVEGISLADDKRPYRFRRFSGINHNNTERLILIMTYKALQERQLLSTPASAGSPEPQQDDPALIVAQIDQVTGKIPQGKTRSLRPFVWRKQVCCHIFMVPPP